MVAAAHSCLSISANSESATVTFGGLPHSGLHSASSRNKLNSFNRGAMHCSKNPRFSLARQNSRISSPALLKTYASVHELPALSKTDLPKRLPIQR